MTQTATATDAARLNRLQAVTQADGVRGNEARLALATDYAMTQPNLSPAQIVAAVKIAIPDPNEAKAPTAPSAPAPTTAKRTGLPDAQAVYAERRPTKGAA